jgi:hypothetical protein
MTKRNLRDADVPPTSSGTTSKCKETDAWTGESFEKGVVTRYRRVSEGDVEKCIGESPRRVSGPV